jgi:hypothetical protein
LPCALVRLRQPVVASERDEALSVKRSEGAPLPWTPQPFPREANLRGDLIGKDFVAAGPGLGINEGASNWNRVGQSPSAFQDFNKGQDGNIAGGRTWTRRHDSKTSGSQRRLSLLRPSKYRVVKDRRIMTGIEGSSRPLSSSHIPHIHRLRSRRSRPAASQIQLVASPSTTHRSRSLVRHRRARPRKRTG